MGINRHTTQIGPRGRALLGSAQTAVGLHAQVGRVRPLRRESGPDGSPSPGGPQQPVAHAFPKAWVGALVAAVVALELGGWWLSHALFLRYVRAHFRAHPPALEGDLALARELGELFGIDSDGNDSVQSYLLRIRRRIGLPDSDRAPAGRGRALPSERPSESEIEEGFV